MRFPRARRLTRRADFQRVRRKGRSYRGRFMILGVLADDSIRTVKVGIITTRRLGNAVIRVQTRRRLRGILQRLGDQLSGGHAMVIIPHASCAPATSAELERDWWKLVKRAGLVNDSAPATPSTLPAP